MINAHEYVYAYPFREIDEPSGGYVRQHPNQNKLERQNNLKIGIILAQLGYKVWLLPVSNEPGVRSADAWLEDEAIFIEFKWCQTPSAAAIDKAIQKAKKQAPYILLEIDCDIRPQILITGVEDRCQRPENQEVIKEVWLLWKGELFKFSREEIVDKSWTLRLTIK